QIAYFIIVAFILLDNIFNNPDYSTSIALLLIALPIMFYSLVCESTMEGQTFGKKLLKIKVVKIDGYQAGFFDYFVRWIFAIVDIQMGFIPGVIAMVSTKHTQRLGDLAAGTAVISEKSKYNISHTILMEITEDYKPYFSRNQMILFSDNDIRIIKENFELTNKSKNAVLLKKIAEKIYDVTKLTDKFESDKKLIETFLKDYNYYTAG
ncbi:MAG: RDD family protein, partial [Paludibacter sp.]|nr:RDD family protein [Paludibacter sp.]